MGVPSSLKPISILRLKGEKKTFGACCNPCTVCMCMGVGLAYLFQCVNPESCQCGVVCVCAVRVCVSFCACERL